MDAAELWLRVLLLFSSRLLSSAVSSNALPGDARALTREKKTSLLLECARLCSVPFSIRHARRRTERKGIVYARRIYALDMYTRPCYFFIR